MQTAGVGEDVCRLRANIDKSLIALHMYEAIFTFVSDVQATKPPWVSLVDTGRRGNSSKLAHLVEARDCPVSYSKPRVVATIQTRLIWCIPFCNDVVICILCCMPICTCARSIDRYVPLASAINA